MFQSNNTNIFLYLQQYHIGYVTILTQYGKVNKLVTYIYSVIRVKCSFGVFGMNAQQYPYIVTGPLNTLSAQYSDNSL
jgi:hypothetical protein